ILFGAPFGAGREATREPPRRKAFFTVDRSLFQTALPDSSGRVFAIGSFPCSPPAREPAGWHDPAFIRMLAGNGGAPSPPGGALDGPRAEAPGGPPARPGRGHPLHLLPHLLFTTGGLAYTPRPRAGSPSGPHPPSR